MGSPILPGGRGKEEEITSSPFSAVFYVYSRGKVNVPCLNELTGSESRVLG